MWSDILVWVVMILVMAAATRDPLDVEWPSDYPEEPDAYPEEPDA